ncbi:MAG: fimbrillin family protein, partial [Alistipes sp.]|nr:fimbrillin family protein [Alistipes sp.]
MKKLLIFALSAVLLAAGCAKESLDSAKNAIVIDPTIADPELFPKTATRATDTDFEPGDRIGVTIRVDGQTHISNREFTFDGATQFFTAPNVRWYDDTSRTAELSAYYPYQAGAEAPVDFAVLPDQNGDNYKASDFIAGLKQEVLPDKKVDLVFKHKMARLIVHVTNETDFDITEILFKGTVGTGCYDCTTCEFCVKAGAAPLDIKACERRKTELYYALLIPQNGVEITAAVITDDGEERDGIIEDPKTGLGAVDLVSGCNRELDLIVTQDGLRIQLSGDIDPWEDGEDIDTDNGDDDKDPEPAQNTVSRGGVEY